MSDHGIMERFAREMAMKDAEVKRLTAELAEAREGIPHLGLLRRAMVAESVHKEAIIEDYRRLLDLVGDADAEIMRGYLAALAVEEKI